MLCKTVRSRRISSSAVDEDDEPEPSGRVAGTVRRHMAIDTRDPPGAILHFFVGDSYDPNRLVKLLTSVKLFCSIYCVLTLTLVVLLVLQKFAASLMRIIY